MLLLTAGKLTRADANHLQLVVPKIELFDVWFQPRATATIKSVHNEVSAVRVYPHLLLINKIPPLMIPLLFDS